MDWQHLDLSKDFAPATTAPTVSDVSFHIVVSDGEILCLDGQTPWRPLTRNEWQGCGLESLSSHYLGDLGGASIFAEEVDPDAEEPAGFGFETLWSCLMTVSQPVFHLIGRASQIVEWHRHHHFCGVCGSVTVTTPHDRSRKCKTCNLAFYPRLSPSIIVLVNRGEEVLLARNVRSPGNFYSTLAGFVEPGESIEEAVHREVLEEVGIRIKNLKYFSSQPWPFPNSLMLGFHAEYDSGDILLQEDEIADAKWFHYTDMPNEPAMISISGWLIDDFVKRMNQGGSDKT